MPKTDTREEVGFVVKAKRYLLAIEGLPSARVNDMLVDENGNRAIVRSLSDDHVSALALSGTAKPGDRYTYLGNAHMYSCGDHLFGRIIDTLGAPVDDKGSFPPGTVPLALEVDAPGIELRVPIHEQLYTGISLVDTLVPIAKGQRQLVFGPMHSGKSTFLTETVLAQQAHGTVCIYAVIGKPVTGLRKISDTILKNGSASKTVIIAALSDEPASVISLTPSVAFLLAEYYQSQGEHVLVILDDLDSHAKYLREIALLEGRLPSTESYPGDIFYQHAHLMERSGHFTQEMGGGSITALPIIQTDFKNFSDLIPTNLMACTDGHLAFMPTLRAEGLYPSISLEQSVTRVGRQSQHKLQKELTTKTQILLGAYRQQKEYAQFSAELSKETKQVLHRGAVVEALLLQDPYHGIPADVQVPLIALAFTSFFDEQDPSVVVTLRRKLAQELASNAKLANLRAMAFGTIELDDYLKEIEKMHPIFTEICQQ
jgi:F-type H+/Na+-transporting ATPase subunit alpha